MREVVRYGDGAAEHLLLEIMERHGQKAKKCQARRQEFLTAIEKAARNYESLPAGSRGRKAGWRGYVMEATGTSQKFLTQIIRRGEITLPKGT